MNNKTRQVFSRREFLNRSSQLTVGAAAMPWLLNLAAVGEAAAFNTASSSEYKALVCLFLYGGNDYANTVVPYDNASYALYNSARSSLALTQAELKSTVLSTASPTGAATSTVLTPLAPAQTVTGPNASLQFALHPVMPELATLFNTQKAAVVFNVGPLAGPTTLAEYYNGKRPLNLYSHSDQQNYWQSGPVLGSGWGGRTADVALANGMNGSTGTNTFTCVSITSNAVFLTGTNANQYHVGTTGAVKIGPAYAGVFGSSQTAITTFNQLIRGAYNTSSTNKLEKDFVNVVNRSMDAETTVTSTVSNQTIATPLATGKTAANPLWDQLRMVAKMIKARGSLSGGVRRQVFMVAVNGFDLHSNFTTGQRNLLTQLNDAVEAFYRATVDLGVQNQVTTFTATDFGRALTPNGDGTDHGWGSHNVVVGGAVKGGQFYGYAPPVNGKNNTVGSTVAEEQFNVGNGRLLPTTSVEQYGATLAKWFGATATDIQNIFPTLSSTLPSGYGAYANTPYTNGVKYPSDLGFMQPYTFA